MVITRKSVGALRPKLTAALTKELKALGLTVELGRITFVPGKEFRVKLTVLEGVQFVPALGMGTVRPKIGESWRYGGKTYTILEDNRTKFIVSRPSRSKRAQWNAAHNGYAASYVVTAEKLIADGIKV